MRVDGGKEGGMERTIISSAWSSVPHTLMVITSCWLSLASYLFLKVLEALQMELACNYNAQSTENRALCEHMGELIIGFLRLPSGPCFHQKCQLDGFKSRSDLKALIKN